MGKSLSSNGICSQDPKKSAKTPLHLRENEKVAKGLIRLAVLQCSAAAMSLRDQGNSIESVHDARTFGKKTRALLQLYSPMLPQKVRRKLVKTISEISGRLAAVRDADVLLETFDKILPLHPEHLDEGIPGLRATIENTSRQRRDNDRKLLPGTISLLNKLERALVSTEPHGMDSRQLRRCLRRTYRRGRLLLKACSAANDPESFHAWRKLVKQLWYQLRITSRRWPSHADEPIRILAQIGELAGRERDLLMLDEFLNKGGDSVAASGLRNTIHKERVRLKNSALVLGDFLYAVRPSEFTQEMRVGKAV